MKLLDPYDDTGTWICLALMLVGFVIMAGAVLG